MYEIGYSFWLDAVHKLEPSNSDRNHYSRTHGHSYQIHVAVRGTLQANKWVLDFGDLEAACNRVRDKLQDANLNDIMKPPPTSENLCHHIWTMLDTELPTLFKVTVARPNLGHSCSYWGPKARTK